MKNKRISSVQCTVCDVSVCADDDVDEYWHWRLADIHIHSICARAVISTQHNRIEGWASIWAVSKHWGGGKHNRNAAHSNEHHIRPITIIMVITLFCAFFSFPHANCQRTNGTNDCCPNIAFAFYSVSSTCLSYKFLSCFRAMQSSAPHVSVLLTIFFFVFSRRSLLWPG